MSASPTVAAPTAYRQGDVLLVPVPQLPPDLTQVLEGPGGRIVLAYGEASGHAHTFAPKAVTALRHWRSAIDMPDYITVPRRGAQLQHENLTGGAADHAPIALPPGHYQVVRQRQQGAPGVRPIQVYD